MANRYIRFATLGDTQPISGTVTLLERITVGSPEMTEDMLGFGRGRLSAGFWVALLTGPLKPEHFVFAGTTLRSGGRYGLPLADPAADKARVRVDDSVREMGEENYLRRRAAALGTISLSGGRRIAKVIPLLDAREAHGADGARPDVAYPMGGGALQWEILPPGQDFLYALRVDDRGVAHSPLGSWPVGRTVPFQTRQGNLKEVTKYLHHAC